MSLPDPDWSIAACRGLDPDLFHPLTCPPDVDPLDCPEDDGTMSGTIEYYEAGKQICSTCPIQPQCKQYALVTKQRFGLWGGLSPLERRRIERRERRQRLKVRRAQEAARAHAHFEDLDDLTEDVTHVSLNDVDPDLI